MVIAHYPLFEIVATMGFFFLGVAWIYVLVVVLSDVFARSDVSGLGKASWALLLILLPFIGVFAYLVAQGEEIGRRRTARAAATA